MSQFIVFLKKKYSWLLRTRTFLNNEIFGDNSIWDIIANDKEVIIIHLVRKNYLRSYLSEKIGEETKKWTESIYKPDNLSLEDKKVVLGYEECLEVFERTERQERITREMFRDHKFIEVTYEDLQKNHEYVLSKIFSFLEVPFKKVEVPNKKQNPENISDLLLNYDELKSKISKTKWKKVFERE